MNATPHLNLCKAYLYASKPDQGGGQHHGRPTGPVVTISRQAGARGNSLADALVAELEQSDVIARNRPWTLFNQNLLDAVIDEHNLPEMTTTYFPEDKPEEIRSFIGELLGLHAGVHVSARKTAETIRRLGIAGNAIIVGRGANLINADIRHALHVRLVGDAMTRVRHFAHLRGIPHDAAAAEVERLDRGRARYHQTNFDRSIDDPCQYDLILNTSRFSNGQAARIIRHALEEKYH